MSRKPTKPPQRARVTDYGQKGRSDTEVRKRSQVVPKSTSTSKQKPVQKGSASTVTPTKRQVTPAVKKQNYAPRQKKYVAAATTAVIVGKSEKTKVIRDGKQKSKETKVGVVNVLLVVLVTMALLYLILQTLLNFFLPTYFKLVENTNILLVEPGLDGDLGKIYFAHFDVHNKKVSLIDIHPQTQVNLLGGYNNYEIRSVYPLLALEKKDEQFVTAAYSFALNEVVDRVVLMPEPVIDELRRRQDLQKLLADVIKKKWREERIIDQQLLGVYFFLNTGISWRNGKLDNEGWNTFHQQNFSKSDAHECAVVVINSTETSGLASRIATVLEKNGYLVTRTGNYGENMSKTTIYYNDESKECMELVSRSMKMFPFVPEVIKDKVLPQRHRAGVVVIAGDDFL